MRLSRRALLLLLAGGIAAFTAVLMHNRLSDAPVAPPVQAARVVIAKHDLVVGSFVQGIQDLDWGPPPDVVNVAAPPPADGSQPADGAPAAVPPGQAAANAPKESYLYEGSVKLTDFNGAVVRRSLHAGDAVPQSALMKSGEGGFMSAVLEPGMRAVSIGVNATSGNAGFVSPGDHIDLIVTHRVKPQTGGVSNPGDEFVASETFVHNVRVVAVDQMLDNPDNKAILAKTLTVEVSPRQAEEIAVAGDLGKISIALRSLSPAADNNNKAHEVDALYNAGHPQHEVDSTRDSDISDLLLAHKATTGQRVHVYHGDKSENMDFDQDKQ